MTLRVYFGDECVCLEPTGDIKTSCTIKSQTSGGAADGDIRNKIPGRRKYIDPVRIRDIKILPETTKARKQEEQKCQCGSFEIHHSQFVFRSLKRLLTFIL